MQLLKIFEISIRVLSERVERLEGLFKRLPDLFNDYNSAFQSSYNWTLELEEKVEALEKRVKALERLPSINAMLWTETQRWE